MAKQARKSTAVNKNQAAGEPAACPIALLNQNSEHLITDIIPIIKHKRRKKNLNNSIH
jgi:hypothetical protein